ncbi:hypothetical protein D3C84_727490 [compost metagenome]
MSVASGCDRVKPRTSRLTLLQPIPISQPSACVTAVAASFRRCPAGRLLQSRASLGATFCGSEKMPPPTIEPITKAISYPTLSLSLEAVTRVCLSGSKSLSNLPTESTIRSPYRMGIAKVENRPPRKVAFALHDLSSGMCNGTESTWEQQSNGNQY